MPRVPLETSVGSCQETDSRAPRKGAATPLDPMRECFILQQYDDVVHSAHTGESSMGGEPTLPDASADGRPLQGGDP